MINNCKRLLAAILISFGIAIPLLLWAGTYTTEKLVVTDNTKCDTYQSKTGTDTVLITELKSAVDLKHAQNTDTDFAQIRAEMATDTELANEAAQLRAEMATDTELSAGLATKEDTISAGTTLQYWRGDKTWEAPRTALDDTFATDTALTTGLAEKEPTVSAGTTADYWRGDKSWQSLFTAVDESFATDTALTQGLAEKVSSDSATYVDVVEKRHVAATAGSGISITGQEITNTDTGSGAVTTHNAAYDHPAITHSNRATLDAIEQALTSAMKTLYDNTAADSHTHANKTTIDGITDAKVTLWDATGADSHLHSNKAVLDATQQSFTTALKTLYDATAADSHPATKWGTKLIDETGIDTGKIPKYTTDGGGKWIVVDEAAGGGGGTVTGSGTAGKITMWTSSSAVGDGSNTDTQVADTVSRVSDLEATDTPTFANVLLSNLTASKAVVTDGSKQLTSRALVQADVSGLTATDSPTFNSITLTQGQIKFPATQNPSADANTLDDYEEGTWTPHVNGGTTTTYGANNRGRYVKIGRHVFISGFLQITSLGDGTATHMDNLPFTIGATADAGCFVSYFDTLAVNTISLTLDLTGNTTRGRWMGQSASDAAMSNLAVQGNGAQILFTGSYYVD